jgi:hypothetical protein
MPDFSTNSRPGSEIWRGLLLQIPTVFGRLVYLSSLRDHASGRYRHPTLSPLLGSESADRTLCHSHHQVFSEWIASSLDRQKSDLDEYLKDAGREPELTSRYRELVPPSAREVERQLYLADVETLLELLRYG